jgi:hypothetical protein
MVCFFCIATIALISGAVGATALEGIRAALEQLAKHGVTLADDTPSTQRLELEVAVPDVASGTEREKPGAAPATVPVAVTVYKKHSRVRVQVLTHDVTRREAEAVQDAVVAAAGLTLVHRSDVHEQDVVHEAVERLAAGDDGATLAQVRSAWQQER